MRTLLVGLALAATGCGGVHYAIAVNSASSRVEEARAVVSISDNGVGIPAQLLPRVFELFVQNERSLDRSQGGFRDAVRRPCAARFRGR